MEIDESLPPKAVVDRPYRSAILSIAKGFAAAALGWANFSLILGRLSEIGLVILVASVSTALYFCAIWFVIRGALTGAVAGIAQIRQGRWSGTLWLAAFLLPLGVGVVGVLLAITGMLYKGP